VPYPKARVGERTDNDAIPSRPSFPVLEEQEPRHERGIVRDEPGLYFLGLAFLYAASSSMLHGVGRDAQRIAGAIATRAR